MEERQI